MKVLIEINRNTWAKIKEYATLQELNLGKAVDQLLQKTVVGDTKFHDNERI